VSAEKAVPEVDAVMDGVVAPIIYRLLFGPVPPTQRQVRALVDACMAGAVKKKVAAAQMA